MTRADNSSFLAQANARRHQAALLAAHHAIEQLQRQGQAVSFSTVAHQPASPGDGSTARTRSATSSACSGHLSRPPPGLPRNAQPPTRSASGSIPPAPRSPACEPRTAPSATSSPASSSTPPPDTTRQRHSRRTAMTPATTPPAATAATCLRRRNTHLPGIICKRLQITAVLRASPMGRQGRLRRTEKIVMNTAVVVIAGDERWRNQPCHQDHGRVRPSVGKLGGYRSW